MKRLVCLLMTLLMALAAAAPALAGPAAELLTGPMSVTLRDLQMDAHMPLDAERLGELNALLRHLTVTLVTGEADGTVWNGLTAEVDGETAEEMWIGETDAGVTLALPASRVLYTADSVRDFDALMGTETASVSAMMVPEVFLADAETLVCAFFGDEEYVSSRSETNNVKDTNNTGYGRAVTRRTMIPVTGAQLKRILMELCPEGPLRGLIDGVEIAVTEPDGIYALCKADGKPAKVVFRAQITDSRGRVIRADVEWKLRRDDPKLPERDHLTVNLSGAVEGTFEFRLTRILRADGSAEVTYDIYRWEFGDFSITRSAARRAQMGWERDAAGRVTGRMDLTVGPSPRTNLTLNLDLDSAGALRGTVAFSLTGEESALRGVAELAPLDGELTPPASGEAIPLPEDAEARAAIAQDCADRVAALLVARLVLMEDQDDTIYLRRGLSDETWSGIVDAARQLIDGMEGEE